MRRIIKWTLVSFAVGYLLLLVHLLMVRKLRTEVIMDLQAAPVPLQPVVKRPVDYHQDYPELFPLQVAMLMINDSDGGLGLVHAFREMGIPFLVTHDLDIALRHSQVFIYPEVDSQTFTPEETQKITQFVQAGGTIFAQQVFANALGPLFGFRSYEQVKSRHWVNFDTAGDALGKYLDRPEERRIPLAGEAVKESFATNGYTSDGTSKVLARFEDGSAALLEKPVGQGTLFLSGVGYDDVIMRAQCNRHYDAFRAYVNTFEPGGDVWLLLMRAWYENFARGAVRLATIPQGQRSVLMLSHDIDWEYSVPKCLAYAGMEQRHHVHSTFFMQAKYVSDANSRGFFYGPNLDVLRKLVAMGFDVESHTVIHSRAFNHFSYGSGDETYTNYRPRAVSMTDAVNGNVLGEVRVSKELLDGAIPGHHTIVFRAGHLRFPTPLSDALTSCSYEFDSSFTAPDVMSNFPYRLTYDRDFEHESPIYEFPVTFEDEASPPLPERIGQALEVIQANADNGAANVILIHTNDDEKKVPAEEALLNGLPPDILVSDMTDYAQFWRARDRLNWQVLPGGSPDKITMKITSAEPVSGLTFEFARSVSAVDGGAKILPDHHRVILPDLQPGIETIIAIRY
jgi:hypothetical protein